MESAESQPARDARRPRGNRRRPASPGVPDIHPIRRTIRYVIARFVAAVVVRLYLDVHTEDRERLPNGPAIVCFNHLNWIDPFVVMAALPWRPRLFFFGPREEDMRRGGRNRLMVWTGATVPYKPGKTDLIEATRRVGDVIDSGGVLAIAGEGRIHAGERELLPLSEGAAYFALRTRVPLVPLAINGTSWLGFRRDVRVSVGEPLIPLGRPAREAVDRMTDELARALRDLVADYPDVAVPGPFGRVLTEWFNDWPEGGRPAAASSVLNPAGGPMRGLAAGASGILAGDPMPEENHGSERPVG
jgi:1-acyl-sn-glycerol-3-phosphate acyltransferase